MCAGSRSHVEHHGSEGGRKEGPAPITTPKALLARPIHLTHPPGSQGYTGLPCTCSYLPNLPPPLGPVSLNDLCRLSPGAATLRKPALAGLPPTSCPEEYSPRPSAYHLPPVQKGTPPPDPLPALPGTWWMWSLLPTHRQEIKAP